jgi:hypothetical protein
MKNMIGTYRNEEKGDSLCVKQMTGQRGLYLCEWVELNHDRANEEHLYTAADIKQKVKLFNLVKQV